MLLSLLCAVVVTGSIQSLQQFYVSPEVAARMASDVRERLAKGEFQSVTKGETLAHQLTADLQEISHDQHLRVHLDTLVMRWPENHTQQYWTAPVVPSFGAHKPVYLLTSRQTFSGGEAFAYNLQALHRVRIVGETTAGAAHLTIPIRVGEHFTIAVPFGRSINPTTGRDWEGTGVVPDVAVKAGDAAVIAYRLALDSIVDSTTDTAQKAQLRGINAAQALRGLAR